LAGYAARFLRVASENAFAQMNKLAFSILLPCMLFYNIYDSDFGTVANPKLLIYGVAVVLLQFAAGTPLSALLTKDSARRGVVLQALFRSNFILFGVPIVQSVYGSGIGLTVVMIAVLIPVLNTLSVVALEIFRRESKHAGKIILNVFKNPLIIASVAGIIFSLFHIPLPAFLIKPVRDLGSAATPLALLALGGTFKWQSTNKNRALLARVAIIRLLVVPAMFLPVSILFGFRNIELLTLAPLLGSPTAVSSFSMAQQMGGDTELAAQCVLITTLFSVLTIFLCISLLSYFGFVA
jgi:predicted permease